MTENTNPEIKTNEPADEVAETAQETVELTEETAPVSADTEETATEIHADAETAETEVPTEPVETAKTVEDEIAMDETAELTEPIPEKKKVKLQIPVIISLCIVVAALLGYFVFTSFFLREPEGVTWSSETDDGTTYYFQFGNDGTFTANVGTIEITSTFEKTKDDDANYLTVGTNVANFYSSASATYEITGSRLLGNQVLSYSYGEGYDFTLTQASKPDITLELPENFVADEDLLGDWTFSYYGYDIYKVTFNNDGSMCLEFIQDGIKYNGTYTLEDGTINFTYYVSDSIAAPIEYSVDGDTLTFLGVNFVRDGSEATVDEAILSVE